MVHTTQNSEGGTSSSSVTQQNEQQEHASAERPQRPEDLPTEEIMMVIAPDDSHYDVKDARFMMSKQVRRKGSARYAIKKLHSDLNDLERARGMIDMALEVKYLSVLWHPNIGKLLQSTLLQTTFSNRLSLLICFRLYFLNLSDRVFPNSL
jgi:hypothetical protein